jgi:hypothetical protein
MSSGQHLGKDAAAPLTAKERAALRGTKNRAASRDDEGLICVTPVPPEAGPPPQFKQHGRHADRIFKYCNANGLPQGWAHHRHAPVTDPAIERMEKSLIALLANLETDADAPVDELINSL